MPLEHHASQTYWGTCIVAIPELCPIRLADLDRNLGDTRPKPLIKSIYQIHFISASIFILNPLRKRFQFWGKPINIYKFYAIHLKILHLQNKMEFYVVYNIISKIIFRYRYKNNFGVEIPFVCKTISCSKM